MASTLSANGSTHSGGGGSAIPTTSGVVGGNGGMDELLPLVMQLTNSEQVRAMILLVIYFC